MKTPHAFTRPGAPAADRVVLGCAWAAGLLYELVACDAESSAIGPVQGLLRAALVIALVATGVNLLRASTAAVGCAFTACFCGLLAATLDLPSVPTVATREMGLYTFLALVTGAFAMRWGASQRRFG